MTWLLGQEQPWLTSAWRLPPAPAVQTDRRHSCAGPTAHARLARRAPSTENGKVGREPEPEGLTAELERLREENTRLRALLGMDERPADGHAVAWSPTLLSNPAAGTAIDAQSSNAAKLELFQFVVRCPIRRVRGQVGERVDRESRGGLQRRVAGGRTPASGPARVSAADRRRSRVAPPGGGDDRHLPAAARRFLHAAGVRSRQGDLGAGRARLPRCLPPTGVPAVDGAFSVRQRWPRLDLLRRQPSPASNARALGAALLREAMASARRAGPVELRPVLPLAGLPAARLVSGT